MLRVGTLRDLMNSVEEKSAVSKNMLDCALGGATVKIPPLFLDVATDAHSVNLVKRLIDIEYTSDTTNWGTAATGDAFSWGHLDDQGLSTSVYVQAGRKLWILARRKNKDRTADEMGNCKVFEGWQVNDLTDDWELEAVHLDSRCVL